MSPLLANARTALRPAGRFRALLERSAVLCLGQPGALAVLWRWLLVMALIAGVEAAWAASVTLTGMLGNRALLIVDGGAPKSVAPGESHQGVKVISTRGDEAVLAVGGKTLTLRVGDAPASVGTRANADGGGNKVVLTANSGGHFMANGSINNRPVQFMVDTGATQVAMGAAEAERLGIAYTSGQPVRLNTANGQVQGYRLRLDSVRLGDVNVFGLDAVVTPQPMPFVLLGNSFLTRFQMRRDADQMTLERRY